jgi:hypothetical protein
VLYSAIQLYTRVFIVINTLDKYYISNKGYNRLLSEVFSLQIYTQVNIFAILHFVPEIILQFERYISKEICTKDNNILRYINRQVLQLLQSQISKFPDFQNTIRQEVVKAVDRI